MALIHANLTYNILIFVLHAFYLNDTLWILIVLQVQIYIIYSDLLSEFMFHKAEEFLLIFIHGLHASFWVIPSGYD